MYCLLRQQCFRTLGHDRKMDDGKNSDGHSLRLNIKWGGRQAAHMFGLSVYVNKTSYRITLNLLSGERPHDTSFNNECPTAAGCRYIQTILVGEAKWTRWKYRYRGNSSTSSKWSRQIYASSVVVSVGRVKLVPHLFDLSGGYKQDFISFNISRAFWENTAFNESSQPAVCRW